MNLRGVFALPREVGSARVGQGVVRPDAPYMKKKIRVQSGPVGWGKTNRMGQGDSRLVLYLRAHFPRLRFALLLLRLRWVGEFRCALSRKKNGPVQ
ncbi:hypothetical protein Enr8_13730 [Blastopirellula retiformator]|uniref:Uncharacterized protein n=1 Tax=Blastopirellula retiformator TaxID=2527970 RepID=A0A5C5VPX3_9BACT|nr:hypothetical protein Enr8_13730 [Blastopirellula retiformator]